MVTLLEKVSITSGYTFRSGLSNLQSGDKPLIRPSDLDNFNEKRISRYQLKAPTIHLNSQDVLISHKGKFRAALINQGGDYVIPSSIFVIKPKTNDLHMPYLVSFLNSHIGQIELASLARGSNIPALSISALGELKIPVPTIEKQRQVAELAQQIAEYRQLTSEKAGAMEEAVSVLIKKIEQYDSKLGGTND